MDIARIQESKSYWQNVTITAGFFAALVTAVAIYIIVSYNITYDAAFFKHPGTIIAFVLEGGCLATILIGGLMLRSLGRQEAALGSPSTQKPADPPITTPPPAAALPVAKPIPQPLPAAAPAPAPLPVLAPVPAAAAAAVAHAKAPEKADFDLHAELATPLINEMRDVLMAWLRASYRKCWPNKSNSIADEEATRLVNEPGKKTELQVREKALQMFFDEEFRDKTLRLFLQDPTALTDNEKNNIYVHFPHLYQAGKVDHYIAFRDLKKIFLDLGQKQKAQLGSIACSLAHQLCLFLRDFTSVTSKPAPLKVGKHSIPPVDTLLNGGLLDTLACDPHSGLTDGFSIGLKGRLSAAERLGKLGSAEDIRVTKLTFQALMCPYHAAFTTKFPKFREAFQSAVIKNVEKGLIPALEGLKAKAEALTFEEVIAVFRTHCRAFSADLDKMA